MVSGVDPNQVVSSPRTSAVYGSTKTVRCFSPSSGTASTTRVVSSGPGGVTTDAVVPSGYAARAAAICSESGRTVSPTCSTRSRSP